MDDLRSRDTNGTVLDLSRLLQFELKNDSVQFSDSRLDETIIAMTRQTQDVVMEILYFRQLDKDGTAQTTTCVFHPRHCSKGRTENPHETEENGGSIPGAEDTRPTVSIS